MRSRSTLADVAFAVALAVPLLPAASFAATLLVANKAEATLSLLDLDSGAVVATLPTGEGPHEIGLSPDGRLALVTNYGRADAPGSTLTLVDVAAARVRRTIALGDRRRPHGVAWLDGRRALVTVEASRELLEIDVETGTVLRSLPTGQEVSHMVAATPDGRRAFVANIGSGTVTAIDLAAGVKLADVATGAGAEGIALAAGGRELWVTNRDADSLTVLDAASLEPLAELPSPGFPIRAAATADARVLVTHARGGHLTIVSVAERWELGRLTFDLASLGGAGRLFGDRFGDSSVPIGVVVAAHGNLAYVAHANADAITEVELAPGRPPRVTRVLRAGREPDGMAWSALAATPASSALAVLDELLATDRGLGANDAADVVTALAAGFAADVVVPLPGSRFAHGRDAALEALRANPDNLVSRIAWAPVRGGLSADGRHGFTFGYGRVAKPDGSTAAFKYLAYWVRGEHGWRIAAYKRGRAPGPPATTEELPPALPDRWIDAPADAATLAAHARSLEEAERSFSDTAQRVGLGPAFAQFGSADAMNLGSADDATFVLGAEAIARAVSGGDMSPTSPVTWWPERVVVAASGDLGVTIGWIRPNAAPAASAAPPGDIPFFTVWRRATLDAPWRYVAE